MQNNRKLNNQDDRVTLDYLIDYVENICKSGKLTQTKILPNGDESLTSSAVEEIDYSIKVDNVKYIDKLHYVCLKLGEMKIINDFPPKLKQMFDPFIKELKRIGQISKFKVGDNYNTSLFSSILSCLTEILWNYLIVIEGRGFLT